MFSDLKKSFPMLLNLLKNLNFLKILKIFTFWKCEFFEKFEFFRNFDLFEILKIFENFLKSRFFSIFLKISRSNKFWWESQVKIRKWRIQVSLGHRLVSVKHSFTSYSCELLCHWVMTQFSKEMLLDCWVIVEMKRPTIELWNNSHLTKIVF